MAEHPEGRPLLLEERLLAVDLVLIAVLLVALLAANTLAPGVG